MDLAVNNQLEDGSNGLDGLVGSQCKSWESILV